MAVYRIGGIFSCSHRGARKVLRPCVHSLGCATPLNFSAESFVRRRAHAVPVGRSPAARRDFLGNIMHRILYARSTLPRVSVRRPLDTIVDSCGRSRAHRLQLRTDLQGLGLIY